MGISYVYKKFKNEDSAIIPFDAHKQYNFTSQSAVNNKLSICHSKWTSESISFSFNNALIALFRSVD